MIRIYRKLRLSNVGVKQKTHGLRKEYLTQLIPVISYINHIFVNQVNRIIIAINNYCNRLTNIIRTPKTMYYNSKELKNAEGNLNSTWKAINKLTNKHKSPNKIDININNQPNLTNSSEIANAFNLFFTFIGPDLASI